MVDTLRIKRRLAGGAAGAPSSLKNAELAFNEQDNTLYYGKGDSSGNATSIIAVGGPGAYQPLDADLTSLAAASGTNTIYYRSAANTWSPVVVSTGLAFSGGNLTATASGGNVSNTGTPANGQWAQWTDATHIQGVVTASMPFVQKAGDTMTGNLVIQKTQPYFNFNSTGGGGGGFFGRTNGLDRWDVEMLNPPGETGGNAGSNFEIWRATDAGTYPDATPNFKIERATGIATFNQSPIVPTPTAGDNSTKVATTGFVTAAVAVPNCGRLTYVSATQLKFSPFNGNKIKINGSIYTIPNAGIAGLTNTGCNVNTVAGQNLAANTTYWIFAFNNAGTITVSFFTGPASHSPSSTAGNEGVEIATGFDTYSLIGMCRTNASAQFADSSAVRGVLSWFNRRTRIAQGRFTADRATASTTMVEIHSEIAVGFLAWAEDAVLLAATGSVNGGAGTVSATTQIYVDGAATSGNTVYTCPTAGFAGSIGMTAALGGLDTFTEGYHSATLYGKTSSSTSGWYGATAGWVCTLTARLMG